MLRQQWRKNKEIHLSLSRLSLKSRTYLLKITAESIHHRSIRPTASQGGIFHLISALTKTLSRTPSQSLKWRLLILLQSPVSTPTSNKNCLVVSTSLWSSSKRKSTTIFFKIWCSNTREGPTCSMARTLSGLRLQSELWFLKTRNLLLGSR